MDRGIADHAALDLAAAQDPDAVEALLHDDRVTAIGLFLEAVRDAPRLRGRVGDLDRVTRVVKLVGFVASVPEFSGQPGVINGASEFLVEIMGYEGRHARAAVGVNALPLNAPVARVHRTAVDQHGVLILIAEGIYRGDVVSIDIKLR